jgi:hypothetical protein
MAEKDMYQSCKPVTRNCYPMNRWAMVKTGLGETVPGQLERKLGLPECQISRCKHASMRRCRLEARFIRGRGVTGIKRLVVMGFINQTEKHCG